MGPRLTTQILRYYSVGTFAVALDVSIFQFLVMLAAPAALAAAIAGPIAAATHFTLNRNWSFRALHGHVFAQASRYVVVYGAVWVVTVAVVAYCVEHLRMFPLEAKAVALALTIPMGFLGHKYFTYASKPLGMSKPEPAAQ